MNIFQRSITYLKRNIFYSVIIIIIIFLLGVSSLIIIFSHQTIQRTEQNLWSGLPAVVSIESDRVATEQHWRENGIWAAPSVTRELIEEIGQLVYVSSTDITLNHHLYSRSLDRHWDSSVGEDFSTLKNFGIYNIEEFDVLGVTQPYFFGLKSGILEIFSGTTFTNEQLLNGNPVLLVSRDLANFNNIDIGSIISLEMLSSRRSGDPSSWFDEPNIIDSLVIDFEVIGIYELQSTLSPFEGIYMDDDFFFDGGSHFVQELNMLNKLYIPYVVLEQLMEFQNNMISDFWGEDSLGIENFSNTNNFIFLHNAQDLQSFHSAVSEILPDFLIARDVSDSFQNIFVAMENILEVSSLTFTIFIGACVILLFILFIFLLQQRKYEIGIYLALGEEKKRIISQFLIEAIILSSLAITLSLGVSQIFSAQIARHLVREEMSSIQVTGHSRLIELEYNTFMSRGENFIDWFVPEVDEIERLIELSDVSLKFQDVLFFYLASSTIVLTSTVLSAVYLMRLEPKKVLTFSERG